MRKDNEKKEIKNMGKKAHMKEEMKEKSKKFGKKR